jgi:hypothetical protein
MRPSGMKVSAVGAATTAIVRVVVAVATRIANAALARRGLIHLGTADAARTVEPYKSKLRTHNSLLVGPAAQRHLNLLLLCIAHDT